MTENRILVDTNAYFRLAQSIHPLLGKEFGQKKYCLYCIKELQIEYNRNPRLQNSFSWVNDSEYVKNRFYILKTSKEELREIKRANDFIYDYAHSVYPGVSKIDALCLAHAEQLRIPVVTDDDDMRKVAGYYSIETLKTLELLKLMLDCRYIDLDKVREITNYWTYLNDEPKDFAADLKRLFSLMPPK